MAKSVRKPPKITRSGKKINKHASNNLVGLVLFGIAMVLAASLFVPSSTVQASGLAELQGFMQQYFGAFSLVIPFLIMLFATHFFKFALFKQIYYRTTGGAFMIVGSLMVLMQGGSIGTTVFRLLTQYISVFGTCVLAIFGIIVGLMFFTNSSLNDIARLTQWFSKGIVRSLKGLKQKEGRVQEQENEETEYIKDEKLEEKRATKERIELPQRPAPTPVKQPVPASGISMRSYSSDGKPWQFPGIDLLETIEKKQADRGDVGKISDTIERTLDSFGVKAKVADVNYGPTVTQYALEIPMGIKLSRITGLNNDIALATAAPGGQVRIEAPIPGRSLVGVEIPNKKSEIVGLKQMIQSGVFGNDHDPLLVPLGLDVSGKPVTYSLAKMPHCLIAGTTGSGKSVIVNAWITTFMMRTQPQELQLILVDPKRVELTPYNGIPHLKTEVIVEPEKALAALKWSVAEMERRYKLLADRGVRGLADYNALPDIPERVPFLIFVIDELADLMMVAGKDVEANIVKIAQKARAVGIHLILATQRPSTDVITGLMKANIPTRLAFNVPSLVDSRVIIDMPGAENLVGKGDMLFLPPDSPKPKRIQGPLVITKEVSNVVGFLKTHYPEVTYANDITEVGNGMGDLMVGANGGGDLDPMFHKALEVVMSDGKASASWLQRRMGLGYNRAAKILDQMEMAGYIGPANGSKPREILRRMGDE